MKRILFLITAMIISATALFGFGTRETDTGASSGYSIAVFVPGFVEGSPTYEMLVAGVRRAVSERPSAEVLIVEGGYNQAEWPDRLRELAATDRYDIVITSNPAMPAICAEIAASFPRSRFLVLDGYLPGNAAIRTVVFNQLEEGYLIGYLAGLVTTSGLPGTNPQRRVGLVAGQEYPAMNRVIRVGYEQGARAAAPGAEIDFRVVGNWFDATRARELADNMIAMGSDVILPIAGGAGQGVIAAAQASGTRVLWFDINGFALAPDVIVGSVVMNLERAAYENALAAVDGTLRYGEAAVLGVRDGYIAFVEDDPTYVRNLPATVRDAQAAMIRRLLSGELVLGTPDY